MFISCYLTSHFISVSVVYFLHFFYFSFTFSAHCTQFKRLSTWKFVSFHRQIQNGGPHTRSKPATGISFTNGKWTARASKTFQGTIRILQKKNRWIRWRVWGNGAEIRAVQMHVRRTGELVKIFVCLWKKKDVLSNGFMLLKLIRSVLYFYHFL